MRFWLRHPAYRQGPRAARGDAGAAVVEFTLIAGILLLFLFGTAECALALNDRLVLEAAAREGARRAAIEGGATARVYERIDALLRAGHLDPAAVEVKISPWSAPYGHSIWVTVSYRHRFITPPVRAALGDGVDLEAKALSRSERLR
jgi:hypothetical protein